MNSKNKVRNWSIAGFMVVVILGFLFHYVYQWTNQSFIAGLFVPVNESVWEHLKLGLWGTIVFSFFEYHAVRKLINNYFLGKAVGILTLSLTVITIFYFYSSFTNKSVLLFDISSFVCGVLLCQLTSYKLHRVKPLRKMNVIGFLFIVAAILIFMIFTYYPPHTDIFKDHRNNSYGIKLKDKIIS